LQVIDQLSNRGVGKKVRLAQAGILGLLQLRPKAAQLFREVSEIA
jgi:hypothetical protein